MKQPKINARRFNVLALEQVARSLGVAIDMLKQAIDCEKERQARAEGFYRDIGAAVERCADAIEKLDTKEE